MPNIGLKNSGFLLLLRRRPPTFDAANPISGRFQRCAAAAG